jgi:hypothetical protein
MGTASVGGTHHALRLNKPITGMVAFGNGYLMVAEDGGIFNFSDRLSTVRWAPTRRRTRSSQRPLSRLRARRGHSAVI